MRNCCSGSFQVNLSSMKKILEIEWILNKAQTHAFTVLGMSQLVHAVGMRDVNRSVFRMEHFENLYMLAALGIGLLLQVLATRVFLYLITLFETNRLTLGEWGRLQNLSLTPLAVHELLCLFTAVWAKASASRRSALIIERLWEQRLERWWPKSHPPHMAAPWINTE